MDNETATLSVETSAPERATSALTKLYVGSLPYTWTAENLEETFRPYGRVTSAAVVADQLTRRSKGFGFVEFESDSDAKKAMSELDGREFEGRNLSVKEARAHVEKAIDRGNGPRFGREHVQLSYDNSESTDTSGRSYGNRRGWW